MGINHSSVQQANIAKAFQLWETRHLDKMARSKAQNEKTRIRKEAESAKRGDRHIQSAKFEA